MWYDVLGKNLPQMEMFTSSNKIVICVCLLEMCESMRRDLFVTSEKFCTEIEAVPSDGFSHICLEV